MNDARELLNGVRRGAYLVRSAEATRSSIGVRRLGREAWEAEKKRVTDAIREQNRRWKS